MNQLCVIFLLLFGYCCILECQEKETLLVDVDQGTLRGKKMDGADGTRYNTFLGIPYAQQPVGPLRFEPPQEPETWQGILDATTERASCLQSDYLYGSLREPRVPEDEACLYLNVHIPARAKAPLPIFVFMHGGGFSFGSGDTDIHGPDYLVSKDVMLVTFNYRTNVFGFLSLDIAEAPGNMGLRDALAALRWVRKNAAAFGGDPEKVTLGGQSAGGVGAHLLALSPLSKGLFHRTIAMSGNALFSWTLTPNNTKLAHELARKLNITTPDRHKIYRQLKEANASDLIKAVHELIQVYIFTSFLPVIEKSFEGIEPVLSQNPYEIAVTGKHAQLPLMLGFTSRECIIFLERSKELHLIDAINLSPLVLMPIELLAGSLQKLDKLSVTASSVQAFFFGNKSSSEETIDEYLDWCSSALSDYKTVVAARVFANASMGPTYLYEFSFDGEGAVFKKSKHLEKIHGVGHCDDLSYLFKINSYPDLIVKDSKDDKARTIMTTLWTNFIKFGDPTPNKTELLPNRWMATKRDELLYYDIDSTPSMMINPKSNIIDFWDRIYDEVKTYA